MVTGADLARLAYAHVPRGAQLQIALYTALLVFADDFRVPVTALEAFAGRLYSGVPQLHPVLDRLVDTLRRMREHYLPFAVSQIVRSTIGYVASMAADNEIGSMPLGPACLAYVTSRRLENGAADAYAHFIWDKFSFPRLETFIQVIP